ncbi:hypothetical protein GCM10009706_14070 [Curtobacterium citreum]|uniref:Uncharacterized protein n=1 Tax=Curtobacterium citreum TaxID=2036 RepID=A0ABT2HDL7_9MICO|nr:hypothetical protein [Curtobacterium citreum]MCS6521365.1 hypothetical protein [Curtobacterium citreum]TQJ28224.1 hypothetical protein FB462_2104 [Curtobacterium citreum]GGL76825.1 hypothetical protein GCM10009706_14070 [Curtobacterium citreum]
MNGNTKAPGAGKGSEGGTENRGGIRVVHQFTPTPAERAKYADYDVVFKESKARVEIEVVDGRVIRFASSVWRVPSTKTFVVWMRSGATKRDRAIAKMVAHKMPYGEWARMPDMWARQRINGVVSFRQQRGVIDDEALLLFELEMSMDETLLLNATVPEGALLTRGFTHNDVRAPHAERAR